MKITDKCRIADAANTCNTALQIIKTKGYKVFLYPDSRENYSGDFWAIKGSKEFIGADPLRLLGVISIWENKGDDWQNNNLVKEDVFNEIINKAFPDSVEDLNKLTNIKFNKLAKDYKMFFERIYFKNNISETITREELFEMISNFYKK